MAAPQAPNTPTYTTLLQHLSPPHTPTPLLAPPSSSGHNPHLTPSIAALELHPCLESLLHIINGDLSSAHFLIRHMQSPPAFEGMMLHALLHRVEGDVENARCWYFDVLGSGVWEFVWGSQEGDHGDGDGEEELGRLVQEAEAGKGGPETNSRMSDYKEGKSEYSSKPEAARGLLPGEVTEFLDRVQRLRLYKKKRSENPLPEGVVEETERRELEEVSQREVERLRRWCERRFGTGQWRDASGEFVGDDPVGNPEVAAIKAKMTLEGEGFRKF